MGGEFTNPKHGISWVLTRPCLTYPRRRSRDGGPAEGAACLCKELHAHLARSEVAVIPPPPQLGGPPPSWKAWGLVGKQGGGKQGPAVERLPPM